MKFTPTDEQWAKMQKHIKSDKYKKEDFFVFETRAVGDRIVPNRYTRLMPEFLKVMEEDAKKGVSLMVNHNWGQLGVQAIPIGKVFDARIGESSQEGETECLYTTQYIPKDDSKIDGYSKNDIINLIESGVLSDTSVGFSTGGYENHICSICGNSIYDFRKCEHIPGKKYIVNEETNEVQTCIEELHKPKELSEVGNNLLMENSLVFDGAYPNAIIQSKIENVNSKSETFKALEGKEKLSEKDVIIGYTSKEGVNLLYKHLEEGGEELAKKKLANEGDEELEETTENVDNVEETVEETSEEVTEETPEENSDVEETPEENEENSDEENSEGNSNEENSGEPTGENLYTEADIISKFGNIADSFESLVQLAKEGLENRNQVIEQALNSGVHSMGNAFNKEIFTKTFSSMSTKDIKEMAEVWENQANMQFSDKKVSKYNVKNEEEDVEEISDYSKFKTANY